MENRKCLWMWMDFRNHLLMVDNWETMNVARKNVRKLKKGNVTETPKQEQHCLWLCLSKLLDFNRKLPCFHLGQCQSRGLRISTMGNAWMKQLLVNSPTHPLRRLKKTKHLLVAQIKNKNKKQYVKKSRGNKKTMNLSFVETKSYNLLINVSWL